MVERATARSPGPNWHSGELSFHPKYLLYRAFARPRARMYGEPSSGSAPMPETRTKRRHRHHSLPCERLGALLVHGLNFTPPSRQRRYRNRQRAQPARAVATVWPDRATSARRPKPGPSLRVQRAARGDRNARTGERVLRSLEASAAPGIDQEAGAPDTLTVSWHSLGHYDRNLPDTALPVSLHSLSAIQDSPQGALLPSAAVLDS